MIPDKDYYADKDGKITDDPEKYAFQVAVAGVNLEDRVAKRYGLDTLVSVSEPNAVRRVSDRSKEDKDNGSSVKIFKPEEQEPQEPVVADEAEESKASVKVKRAAKKGEKK